MDEPRDCHTGWSNSDREGEIVFDIPCMKNLKRNDTNELIYKTETDSQIQKINLWLPGVRMGEGWLGSLGSTGTHCCI